MVKNNPEVLKIRALNAYKKACKKSSKQYMKTLALAKKAHRDAVLPAYKKYEKAYEACEACKI